MSGLTSAALRRYAAAQAARQASIDTETAGVGSRPAFIEQQLTGFFGRGMLTGEQINVITEQALIGSYATGSATIIVADTSKYIVGGSVTVKHDGDRYGTYFVDSKDGQNIGIRPALRWPCTAGRIERTWYNRAHPGKFYIRELAQRVARSTEIDAAMPGRRVLFSHYASNPTSIEDKLIQIGNATVNYYDEDNTGETGTTETPVRFIWGRSAYVENLLANGDGVRTAEFDARGVENGVVKVALYAASTQTTFSVEVFDEQDMERAKFVVPSGPNNRVGQLHTFPVDLRGAKAVWVRIAVEFYGAPGGYLIINQLDIFEAPPLAGRIVAKQNAKIVCLGDSWVEGDLGNTPEREPLTTQLALELPYATIINKGVGGNKVTDLLARFDADVPMHKPDYVVINVGTNECYSPLSATFYPNGISDWLLMYRRLLNKVAAIGARPIIIGVPALAQSDDEVPALAEWTLNDRAKTYARYFFEAQADKPVLSNGSDANGAWTRFDDGTMVARTTVNVSTVAADTVGASVWTFPIPFAGVPSVTATIGDYSTAQVLGVGTSPPTSANVNIRMVSASAAAPNVPVECVAVGRWR